MSDLVFTIYDVEHGACAIFAAPSGRIAMVDCGHNNTTGWRPSTYIRYILNRKVLDHMFITNADHDHLSDFDGLWLHGVDVTTLHRNPTPTPATLRKIKEQTSKTLTDDLERYLMAHRDYTAPVPIPFNIGMGGATCESFFNPYPVATNTNDLSLVVFINYGGFTICFPGDVEEDGWRSLLLNPAFVAALRRTTVLVASHHGRLSGFCPAIFRHCLPRAVVISDKSIVHGTQEIDYSCVVNPEGIVVTNQISRRHVLTTRRDGDITFRINPQGDFWVTTQRNSSRRLAA